jgi:WD40 repeat protein
MAEQDGEATEPQSGESETAETPREPEPPQGPKGPAGFRLRQTLRGHGALVYRMAWSSDGRLLATPSQDRTVRLWELESGGLLRTLEGHAGAVVCVAWSPGSRVLASGGGRREPVIRLWNVETGELIRTLEGHEEAVKSLAWSPDARTLASGSDDGTIRLWNPETGNMVQLFEGHRDCVGSIAWSPDGMTIASGSMDGTIRLWDCGTGREAHRFEESSGVVWTVAWNPDGKSLACGTDDHTVQILDTESGRLTDVLEGHVAPVVWVSPMPAGGLLGSLSETGTLILWRTDTWAEVAEIRETADPNVLSNFAFHPEVPILAAPSVEKNVISIWDLDLPALMDLPPAAPPVHIVSARAVIVGEPGVGKSALGARMAGKEPHPAGAPDGPRFRRIPIPAGVVSADRLPDAKAELSLWTFPEHPGAPLVREPSLENADAVLLLLDGSDPADPLRGVSRWSEFIQKHAPSNAPKLMVSTRTDTAPPAADDEQLGRALAEHGFGRDFPVNIKTGAGAEPLVQHLCEALPWTELPRVTMPRHFRAICECLLERKEAGDTLTAVTAVREEARMRCPERQATEDDIESVAARLEALGLVLRLDPQFDEAYILLAPEKINQYASAVRQAARDHPQGLGLLPERRVAAGSPGSIEPGELPPFDEKVIYETTLEQLLDQDVCFREMGFLVFPGERQVKRPAPPDEAGLTVYSCRLSGHVEDAYASLVTRLRHADYFRCEALWMNAADFSREGNRLGLSVVPSSEENAAALDAWFSSGLSDFDRMAFLGFITEHLQAGGIQVREDGPLTCTCGREIVDRDAVAARIHGGHLEVACQYCTASVMIPRAVERRYRMNYLLSDKQAELEDVIETRKEKERDDLAADRAQYGLDKDPRLHILHLSDIRLEEECNAWQYRTQLEADLSEGLGVGRLEYLVLSGDITRHGKPEEFDIAFEFVERLVKRFGLDSTRVVVAPGNHDVSWDLSEEAYRFIPKRKLEQPLDPEVSIPAGEAGALLRDDALYEKRFDPFNTRFYTRLYGGWEYPLDPAGQAVLMQIPEDRILFLSLNSCWEIDHHHRTRAGIHREALSRALDRLGAEPAGDRLRVAVWHHPVTGLEKMNDEFLSLLAAHRFQVVLHGHVHDAIRNYHVFDEARGLHIIGAGTSGAPAREPAAGIPLQYNLLTFDPAGGTVTVQSRRKDRPDGIWSPDPQWNDAGDAAAPEPFYSFGV